MRGAFFLIGCAVLTGLAYWAYSENYKTQAELERVEELRYLIADRREAISVLTAEWAYLNRPDRLHKLADSNFDQLKLIPMTSDHFGSLASLPDYQPPQPQIPERGAVWVDGQLQQPDIEIPRVKEGGHYP
ncbi:MAG: cell division protein FtsL [Pseudomonadota bacterium]